MGVVGRIYYRRLLFANNTAAQEYRYSPDLAGNIQGLLHRVYPWTRRRLAGDALNSSPHTWQEMDDGVCFDVDGNLPLSLQRCENGG